MVVMDRIDREYELLSARRKSDKLLRDSILGSLEDLHQAGYVHGVARGINVMVRKDGSKGFMLVDFDWSGVIGKVFYTINVNKGRDLWRPEGAEDHAKILSDHDIKMATAMFTLDC